MALISTSVETKKVNAIRLASNGTYLNQQDNDTKISKKWYLDH